MYATSLQPTRLALNWIKCTGNVWGELLRVNLGSIGDAAGVYVIWSHELGRYIRVGQGIIADRLAAHCDDADILDYLAFGPLFVTWARLEKSRRDGVEAFLAEECQPLVGQRFPDRMPIAVYLPR